MKQKALWSVVVVPILSSLLFQGCAGKHTLKKELIQPAQLRVVTSCVPRVGVKVRHSGGRIAAIITQYGASQSAIALIAEPFAFNSVEKWEAAVEKNINSAGVPRYYELVMQKVIEKVGQEIPDWQPVVVDDQGISPGIVNSLTQSDPGPLLILDSGAGYSVHTNSCAPGLSTGHGLESKYRGRLYIRSRLVWEKKIAYFSDHEKNRYRKIEVFGQNNWELLKEEMEYAAGYIGGMLVEDLKREIRRAE